MEHCVINMWRFEEKLLWSALGDGDPSHPSTNPSWNFCLNSGYFSKSKLKKICIRACAAVLAPSSQSSRAWCQSCKYTKFSLGAVPGPCRSREWEHGEDGCLCHPCCCSRTSTGSGSCHCYFCPDLKSSGHLAFLNWHLASFVSTEDVFGDLWSSLM